VPSGLRYDTVTFLSDYGTADEFVGVVHSVIRSITPELTVLDLTHEISPHDVRAGSLVLARSAQYLCPGIVLAVVDPGVGTDRRPVAVEVGEGASVLVGPDNGLLAPAVGMVGGATRAVVLDRPEHHLPSPGDTFAGRDLFAPVVAALAQGLDLHDVGTPIDPAALQPAMVPLSREEDGNVVAQILWIDRFGNAQLNVGPEEVEQLGERVRLRFGGTMPTTRSAAVARTFADVGSGQVGLVVDSYGLLAVAMDRRSAATELGLSEDDPVTIEPIADDEPEATRSVTSSVSIGTRPPEAQP
jgi:S-adenosylmethionine hydrolase